MHPRESIMQNLKTTLEGIVAISDALKDSGNSALPNDLILQTSGTYTGSGLTTYTVEITTAGASGTAQCTVTGADPSGPHTITTATPISIGALGVDLTFTFTGDMQIGDKWTLSANDAYTNSVKKVQRIQEAGMVLDNFPGIVIAEAPQDYNEPQSKLYTPRMGVIIEAWMKPGQDPGTALNTMLEDIEIAVAADPNRGGAAFETQFVRAEPNYSEEVKPYVALSMEIAVTFKQVI